MLGTNENLGTANITWASLSNGKIVVKSDANDTKAVKRTNKLGNEVYERFYDNIYGRVKHIAVETNKFEEEQVRFTLEDETGERKVCLSFNLDSSYGRAFLAQIFNVDLSRMIIVSPWQKINEEGQKISRLYLSYGGRDKVEYKLPEGTPEVKWIDNKGKKIIDTLSQIQHKDFLLEKLNDFIIANNLVFVKPEQVEGVVLTPQEEKELAAMKKQASSVKGSGVSKGDNEVDADDFFASL